MIESIKNHVQEVYDRLAKEKDALIKMQNKEFELGRLETSMNSIEALLKDIEGEVTLAFAKDYSFNHWGFI